MRGTFLALLSLLTCLLIMPTAFSADNYVQDEATEAAFPFHVTQRVINPDRLSLTLQVDEPEWETVNVNQQELFIPTYPMGGYLMEEGQPMVPSTGRLFRIPPRADVRVEILEAEYETITDVDFAAFYPELEEGQYGIIANVEDAWYPEQLVMVGEPAIFHDFRVANLTTFPVQVNPARREARIYNNIQVDIRYEGENPINQLDTWPTQISEAFIPFYRSLMDWDENELDEYQIYRGHVQVVLENDANLMELMEPWFEWKKQRGWIIDLITDDDVTLTNAQQVKAELQDRYEDANPKFDYVVLVGDNGGAWPIAEGGSRGFNGYGDLNYSLLAGNDDLADVGIGRISVENNSDVNTYVNKVLTYERDIDFDEMEWYGKGCVTVSESHGGNSKRMLMRYWRDSMLTHSNFTEVDTNLTGNEAANNDAITWINEGVSVYATRGYIGSGLSNGQIYNLNNTDKTPIVVDVTCGTGNWGNGEGTNEAYMRAGTPNSAKGAIGGFGTATSSTQPAFNNPLSYGSAWSLLVARNKTLGDMKLAANVTVYNAYHGFNNGSMNDFNTWYNLMGDPTVWAWTGPPQVLDVDASDTNELGQNAFEVSVMDGENPIVDAWVTIYKYDDDEEVLVRGYTDANGYVNLNAPIRHPGEAILTVSSQHYAPFQLEIDVISPEARVGFDSVTFQDDGEDGTVGNDNGIPEAGETVGLVVNATNFGDAEETNLTLSADFDDEWLIGVDGEVNYGTVPSGESSIGEGMILVEIAPHAQHNWNVHLSLAFTSDAGTYEDDFPITIQAPDIAFVEITGANNFDPGDEATVSVRVKNVGGSNAAAGTAILETLDPFLGVVNSEANITSMNVGVERVAGTFTVAAHPETFSGHMARAQLILNTDEGQVDTVQFSFPIGSRSASDPSGPDSYGYYAFEDQDAGFELSPVYEWVEINPEENNFDFQGEELPISDPAENTDDSEVIELPFMVQYYGESFNEMTVFGNGYISMGTAYADVAAARNFPIPSAAGAGWMIAPYWDELRTTGDASILTYWDEENGRFIVEWSNIRNGSGNDLGSFEVIFYTQDARPTYTGDTDIIFQYGDDFDDQQGNMSYDVPWYTTGIENGGQDDGIQIMYWNQASPGAHRPVDGTAILFSTNVALIVGYVEGTVTDIATGDPIAGAVVATADNVFSGITDENGHYIIEEVIIGDDHHFVADAIGYNPLSHGAFEVTEDDTITVNFQLTHPEFMIDTEDISYTIPADDSSSYSMTVTNNGNGPLEYDFR
ncbi:carboxypeptidase regulatory-like domain-containing protein, partial [bacterium]|nr:carboxypeptidase regulatory-like domain-containing protein [bacterium]